MTDFLRTLLGVSLTGGVFILAAVLVRAGLRNRLPKRFLVLLWAAVLTHLLMLVWAPSPTSIYNYVGFRGPGVVEEAIHWIPPAATRGGGLPSVGSDGWAKALAVVWAAGVVALGGAFFLCSLAERRRFADAILLKGNPIVERWRRRHERPVRVYVSDRTETPLSCGLFRPRIILPLDFGKGDAAQLESVLEHEYVHGSQYHNAMKSLVGVAVVMHWFNPAVWLFWLLLNHDLELACDERVLRALGAERRAEYARSLVATAERAVATLPLASAFNARNLRERIVDVMGFKRSSGFWLAPEILLVAALFAVFGTAPAGNPAPAKEGAMPPASQALVGVIPVEEARQTAERAVGGGRAVDVELKWTKAGASVYEVKVVHGKGKYEVELNALDGKILEVERD